MNGYSLSAEWFEYMARNNDKVELKHTAMYLYIVEMFNKREWVEVIGLPTDFTMSVLNIKSYKTYKSILDDLIAFGFVNLVSKATNDHTSNKIALVKNTKADTKVKPKYVPKLSQSNDQSKSESCSTYINIETLKPETLKLINENASLVDENLKDWIKLGKPNSKEVKNKYGEFQNVLLTETEYNSSQEKYKHLLPKMIKKLDEYIASKGTKYKSHYATFSSWVHDSVVEDMKKNTQSSAHNNHGIPVN